MIFLTAFSHSIIVEDYMSKRSNGQYFKEYCQLLRSIHRTYPKAIAVLYLLEGDIDEKKLFKIHGNLIMFDYRNKFKTELGIDVNILYVLKSAMNIFKNEIVLLDSDNLVIRNFDHILKTDVHISAPTRGNVSWRGHRQDIIFNAIIIHNKDRALQLEFIDQLIARSMFRATKDNDYWSNVQSTLTDFYLESGVNTEVDMKEFRSTQGVHSIKEKGLLLQAVPQYVISYPIQEEKRYDQTCIVHYKNHSLRKEPEKLFDQWMQ